MVVMGVLLIAGGLLWYAMNHGKKGVELTAYNHKAVLVTSAKHEELDKALTIAMVYFRKDEISQPLGRGINYFKTFMIAPCGSWYGWDEEKLHDQTIEKFIGKMRDMNLKDVDVVVVEYGQYGAKAHDRTQPEL